MMPGMDGFEVCRRLKSQIATAHLPVVLVTALDQPADRVRGLEAGADDFLTKPIDEIALIARVRSLARLKVVIDELRNRADTTVALGMIAPFATPNADDGKRGRVLIVDDRASSAERLAQALNPHHNVYVEPDAHEALFKAAEDNIDLIVVSLGLAGYDGLRLCSQIRSLERTRNLPILVIADLEDRQRVLRGLELGRQRLPDPPGRPQRIAGAGAHAVAPEALRRLFTRKGAAVDRTGAVRSADRPQQPPLHGKPSRPRCSTTRACAARR